MLHDGRQALVVDPGDAQPVLEALQQLGVQLEAILVTHHHLDHTGGVAALREATGAKVFGPAREVMPEPLTRLGGGDQLQSLGLTFQVIDVPGHTAGHIAYYCANVDGAPLLFCGDTLFSGGCGRLFEGSPAQMLASLDTLAALPEATRLLHPRIHLEQPEICRCGRPHQPGTGPLHGQRPGLAVTPTTHLALHPPAGAPDQPFFAHAPSRHHPGGTRL